MAEPEKETETRFAAVFGSSALKVHDKIFAMISSSGQFVVRLPKARVDALVAADAGERFDANRGRPVKEWLDLRSHQCLRKGA